MAIKPIELLIRAKDEASGVLSGLKGQLMAVAGIIAAYFGIDAYKDAVNSAAEFEAAMSRVKAATGATADEMAALKKAAEDAAAGSSYSAVESAGALENLAKAGLDAKDAIATLPAVLALAQAGDVELADSADYISKAIQGMGLQFAEAGRVADVLAMGANASSTNVKGLAEALSYSAPVAKSLGVSLESTVAMIGQFANAGIDASRAGTALNSIMSQFQDPGSKFRGELAAAGITTGNFEEALHQLAKAGAIGGKAIIAVGMDAGPALVGLLNKGMPALDELKGKLIDSAGSAQKFAEVMKNNLNGSMGSLASAWEAVQLKLGTPVLPVLKDAVDQLAGALKAAVADGTAQRFGEAIAAAFQSGAKWAKDFVSQINFTQVAADLRAFADRTGEVFTKVGEYASTAGNSAKLAYGVMSAGANAVLAGIYGIGSVFAEVASKYMEFHALLRDGLAKISFGALKERFQQEAQEMRNMAQGFGDAAQAMRDKAAGAMQDVADSSKLARDGFTGLATSAASAGAAITGSQPGVAATAAAVDDLGAKLEATRQKSHDAEKATSDKKAADEAATVALRQLRDEYKALVANGDLQGAAEKMQAINMAMQGTPPAAKATAEAIKTISAAAVEQKQAADTARAALEQLIKEYNALNSKGDLQGAAEKMQAINKAMLETPPAAKDAAKATEEITKALQATVPASKEAAEKAAAAAKAIADAFAGLGVTSQAELKRAAESAHIYYERIKGDASSTAVDIGNAFKATADAAIKANNGVAPSWVNAEAAARGYTVQVDSAGKATLAAAGQGAQAVNKLAEGFKLSAEQIKANQEAMDRLMMRYTLSSAYSERQIALLEKENALSERRNALERKRLNIDKEGYSLNTAGERVTAQVESQASIYARGKSAGLTDAQALQLSNETALPYNGPAIKIASPLDDGSNWSTNLQKKIDELVLSNAAAAAAAAPATASAPAPAPAPAPAAAAPAPTYVTNFAWPIGGGTKTVRTQDADSQAIVNDILRQLADARSVSAR